MIFGKQVAGSRAILRWTLADLAERAGCSVPTIQKIEDGKTPTVRTQKKLIRALEKEGLVFTSTGIEERNPILFVEGSTHEEAYLKLLKDAFDHLRDHKNKELLIMYADDSVSPPSGQFEERLALTL